MWKQFSSFQKVKQLFYDLAIPLQVYTREQKLNVYTEACTRIPTAALCIMAEMWKQPKCASATWMDTQEVVCPHWDIIPQ